VPPSDLGNDREPQTRAPVGGIAGALKPFEDQRPFVFFYAGPTIQHPDSRRIADFNVDRAAGGRMEHRVFDEIRHRERKRVGIATHQDRGGGRGHFHAAIGLNGERSEGSDGVPDDFRQIDIVIHRQGSGIEPGDLKHLRNQAADTCRVTLERRLQRPRRQGINPRGKNGDGRSQFVSRVGGEALLNLIGAP
jgi:hypothetical protein